MEHWPFETLTPMRYGAILADPPWAYVMRSEKGHAKSPEAHYATMPLEEIKALPVRDLAGPDCYLFLWSTWPHLPQAMNVLDSWGFSFVTGGAWIKRGAKGGLAFGTGYVLRSASEPFLVGKIGRPEPISRSERNVIVHEDIPDAIEAVRREHSRKPPQMREMIERILPWSFCCELFARERWPGHDVWGNEIGKFRTEP
ncbi:MAG: S-adenosylmethionine-binding protein [Rhodobacterales bacterium 65-51]|uniref:MT-A70 family methyltransferase n=1 Tax=uncultured Gemmobacter sp. TaxID=1095917 RepID=UPI00095E6033|nr:MT-A70 family methyltransferase [uncultured Gemmobacter sp.]OJY33161.1 MAG: S-adenosylmethionine-binding protein [Rhodobacterales bacterium 65-51]